MIRTLLLIWILVVVAYVASLEAIDIATTQAAVFTLPVNGVGNAPPPPGNCPTLLGFTSPSLPPVEDHTVKPAQCFVNTVGINLHDPGYGTYSDITAPWFNALVAAKYQSVRSTYTATSSASDAMSKQIIAVHNAGIETFYQSDACTGKIVGTGYPSTSVMTTQVTACRNQLIASGNYNKLTGWVGPNEVNGNYPANYKTGTPQFLKILKQGMLADSRTAPILVTTSGLNDGYNSSSFSGFTCANTAGGAACDLFEGNWTDMNDVHIGGGFFTEPFTTPETCSNGGGGSTSGCHSDQVSGTDAWYVHINRNMLINGYGSNQSINSEWGHSYKTINYADGHSCGGNGNWDWKWSAALIESKRFVDLYRAGVSRNMMYEMMDEGPGDVCDGILKSKFDSPAYGPWPEYKVMSAINNALFDSSVPSVTNIGYTLSGTTANTRSIILEKADGSYWLIIYEQVEVHKVGFNDPGFTGQPTKSPLPATTSVTLHLTSTTKNFTLYRPISQSVTASDAGNTQLGVSNAAGNTLEARTLTPLATGSGANFTFTSEAGLTLVKMQ